ncbi:helix-turn-helix domain-containing protein [Paenibacillus ginsengarvi]|uniref:AraC family transcriptional regulator n=1 Tax=Paenibacillus ginsengarvi TaxID=400777 RepID=A0A3B0CQW6_9BACL|nr:AraC family transcriptional regulator [Paenibacillus ginsengarvi]RKN86149.1 AraC family transcriptional regulator [Paenibacillus ginsengarvi]
MARNRLGGGTFRKTFLSYTAILIIPILIFCAINVYKGASEEQRRMYDKHREDAKRIADSVDNKLKMLKGIGEVYADEAWAKKLMLDADVYDNEIDLLKDLEIRKDLQNAAYGSGIASFASIVYPAKRIVVSPWGVYDSDYFFTKVASFDSDPRSTLWSTALQYHILKLLPRVEMKLWGEAKTVVPVLQSLEVVNEPRAVLALFIDSSYMSSFLRQYMGGTGPAGLSVMANGMPVFEYGGGDESSGRPGEEYDTFALSSQVSEWEYVISYPSERMIGIDSMLASLMAAAVSIVIGTMSAYVLAKLSYRPLGILLHKLSNRAGIDPLRNGKGLVSEYNLIETSIDRLLNENESLQQAVQDYKSAARSNTLLRLLKGYFKEEQQAERLMQIGLRYTEQTYFCTMLIDFRTVYESFDMEAIRKIEIIAFMAVEKSMSARRIDYQLFEVTNAEKAIIVSAGAPFGGESAIRDIASEVMADIRANCGSKPEVLWGTIEQGLLGISKSYYVASEKLHYLLFSNGNDGGADGSVPAIEYYYPTDWEVQLINNLKIGNLDTWMQIVDEIREENESRQLSEACIAKLISSMMETMLRVLNELNIDAELVSRQFASKLRENNADGLWGYVYEVGTLICERIRYSNTPSAMERGNDLLQYVNSHYTSADMSLKKLAEKFHLSVSGVSKMFKEVTGINFYDYLCRLRMELAKELLREKKGELGHIAQLVGYENVYSFKRAFVRYEGIKPDEYVLLSI